MNRLDDAREQALKKLQNFEVLMRDGTTAYLHSWNDLAWPGANGDHQGGSGA